MSAELSEVPQESAEVLLSIRHLVCEVGTPGGPVRPVDDISFVLEHGKTLGLVGESGAGKSMTARALMGITPRSAKVSGDIILNGRNLMSLSKREHRKILGAGIALIFQDPMTSLNPVVPVGRQITEGMRFHQRLTRSEARERALDLLNQVGISEAVRRFKQYPHELSGGMRQRVTIAAALACDPEVLIADEATTALDVTVQRQILDLLQELQAHHNMGLIIITHDLGIVAGRTDDIAVMYAGQIVEQGPTALLFRGHRHRYTAALLKSMPLLENQPHTKLHTISGVPPRPSAHSVGCRFQPRCEAAIDQCGMAEPAPVSDFTGHLYKCFHPVDVHDESHVAPTAVIAEPTE